MPPARTVEFLARFLSEACTSDELVEWAVQALVDGYDTPALVDLACLSDPRIDDAGATFLEALRELGVEVPSRDEALREHVRAVASQIVSGELSPIEGAALISQHFPVHQRRFNVPSGLSDWLYIYAIYALGIAPDKLDELILNTARETVVGG